MRTSNINTAHSNEVAADVSVLQKQNAVINIIEKLKMDFIHLYLQENKDHVSKLHDLQ